MTPCGFIPVTHGASVELIYLVNGEICENQFHVTKGTDYSAADITALRMTVDAWDAAHWATFRANNAALVRIRCRALHASGAPMEDYLLPTPRNGGQPAGAGSNNTTWCLKKATGVTGRSYRGRWYIVGLTSTYYGADSNHVSAVAGANVVGALNTLLPALSGAGHTLVVVSYRVDKHCRTIAATTPVTGFVYTDLLIDSMRKRLTGRGH